MELDEFKTLVRNDPPAPTGRGQVWAQQVLRNLNNQAIVVKLRRNLRLELFFALAFMLFIGFTGMTSKIIFVRVFAVLMFAFSLWFIAYVVKLYRRVSFDQVTGFPVCESLRGLIRIMADFTRLYFQLTMIMIPVMVLLVFTSAYLDQLFIPDSLQEPFPAEKFLVFLGLSSAWFVLMYFATKWYLKKLYGGYLASLKKNLRELENDE